MSVKANWFGQEVADSPAPALVADGFDPLDEASSPVMFRPGGKPIDLSTPEPQLRLKLDALLRIEGRLDSRGITCPIKDMPDASCLACPLSHADHLDHEMCTLCRVGVQEEIVLAALVAKRVASDQGDV